jgi:hypothetical protein
MPSSRRKSSTTKPRSSTATKKPCSRGASCPYQHETQHTQEYSHNNSKPKPFISRGYRLGGGGQANPKKKPRPASSPEDDIIEIP